LPIGFDILHKQRALEIFVKELESNCSGKTIKQNDTPLLLGIAG
jgi:hypothetical protein